MTEALESVELTIWTHYYGGTYIGRCCGQVASCTSSPDTAAARAADKYLQRLTGFTDSELIGLSLTRISEGFYVAHAVLRRKTPPLTPNQQTRT